MESFVDRFTALLFFSLIFLPSCSKKAKPMGQFAVPVTVATVAVKDVPVQIEAVGNVEAYRTVSVKAMVAGEIVKVHFREGQDVKKGDPLFTIDPRPFEVDLAKSQANSAKDTAVVKQAQATLAKDVAQAKNARTEVHRYVDLINQGYVSQEQYDQIRTNASAMEATVQADEAALQTARESLGVDKSAVENAKLQLQYCYIHAPMDGRTGSVLVHEGNLVKANDTPPLLIINQIQPVDVVFAVPQEQLDEIKTYMARGELKVEAVPASQEANPVTGKLAFVDNAVDATTGTVKVKGIFKNESRTLWPGRFANVKLTLRIEHNAVVVPTQAVQTGQNGSYVFVIGSDMVAQIRPVVVALAFDGESVIRAPRDAPANGLKAGETVVTDGQLMLGPGAKVSIKDALGKVPNGGMNR